MAGNFCGNFEFYHLDDFRINIFEMDRLLKFCSRLAMATTCEHSKFGIIFSKFY